VSLRETAREFALSRKVGFGADRKLTIGASDIGKCARRVKWSKLGTEPDPGYVDSNGFATRGDVMENAWSAPFVEHWVKKHGGELLYAGQENQVTLAAKKVPISATPDGLAVGVARNILEPWGVKDIGKAKSLVTELKSISPRYGKHKLPKQEHVPQTLMQLGLVRAATKHKPEYGCVIYVDADDYFNIDLFPVKWSEAGFKSLVKRADYIMRCNDPNALLPEGKMRGGSECSECPFAKRCLGYRPFVVDDDPRAPTKKQVEKIDALAAKMKEWEHREEEAKKRRLQAEADLYLGLGDIRRNFVKGKFAVHAKVNKPQLRNDAKKLIELAKQLGATEKQLEACKSETKESTTLSVEAASA